MPGVSDAIIIAGVTGAVSAVGTVAALRVKVQNVEDRVTRLVAWLQQVEQKADDNRHRLRD